MHDLRGAMSRRSLNISILAPGRFSIAEPFAGGLEHHTAQLADGLSGLGHSVTLYARDAAERFRLEPLDVAWTPSDRARRDVGASSDEFIREQHAYLGALRSLMGRDDIDIVHDLSGHPLPVVLAGLIPATVVTALHTPPTPAMESALLIRGSADGPVVTVSQTNALAWNTSAIEPEVILNGIDLDRWCPRASPGTNAVWTGRLVAEKAPHLAIEATRKAGLPLDLAGPIHDPVYFEREIYPHLGADVTYHGHLGHDELAALVAAAGVAIVTSMWDEPFGQVVAEALACGTPVAGFASGAIPELVHDRVAQLVDPGDSAALAGACQRALNLDRSTCRAHAVARFDEAAMFVAYSELFVRTAGCVAPLLASVAMPDLSGLHP